MRTVVPVLLLAGACKGQDEAMDPEIVAWTVDPTEVAAGGEVTSTVELAHFELSGHDMDTTDMTMSGEGGHDGANSEHEVQVGHVHIYLDDLETNPLLMQVSEVESFTIPLETTPGEHVLIARLQDESHLIIEPQVTEELTITVLDPGT